MVDLFTIRIFAMKKTVNNRPCASLASLAAQVQAENHDISTKVDEVKTESVKSLGLKEVSDIARRIKEEQPKVATMYVSVEIKSALERLKLIEGFEKLPLSAVTAAILEGFLSLNEREIKELLMKKI